MSSVNADGFESGEVFELLQAAMSDEAIRKKAIAGAKAVIVFTLKNSTGKQQSWVLDLKNEGTLAKVDKVPKNDVQLLLSDADFVKLANGNANGQKLFMSGKLKLKGNMMKGAAIEGVFKNLDPRSKL
ncbi:oleate-induced peroxisomal protein Pox18p [Diutina catenulata]